MEEQWNIKHEEITFEKQLGRGSFGEVWKGEYQGTPVAIKQLYEVDNTEMEKYFARELDALTRLNHPYIVQLLGMARTTDHIFIVTEFVENGDLHSKLIDPAWEFNWKRRVSMSREFGLTFYHKAGIFKRCRSCNGLFTQQRGTVFSFNCIFFNPLNTFIEDAQRFEISKPTGYNRLEDKSVRFWISTLTSHERRRHGKHDSYDRNNGEDGT